MKSISELCFDPHVAAAELSAPVYSSIPGAGSRISAALNRVADQMKWSGTTQGPFGNIIPPGARVLIKPNLVLHENEGPWGVEPLVTHQSLIEAVTEGCLRAKPSQVLVGDAPIQSCDFEHLLEVTGLGVWADNLERRDSRFKGIRDFRRTTGVLVHGVRVARENLQAEERYTLFDLAAESLLESISNKRNPFRVSWYDPRLMAKTHGPGRHQYLVAKEVLESDVIINMPKLKTHRKAGVTCALKNLIGINGNKEYLPHHRLGGSRAGGDCYPGSSEVKMALERVADQQNLTTSYAKGMFWHGLTFILSRVSRFNGDRVGIDGSWSGNDTIWRTSLDLNRILLYGRIDGTLSDELQRRVIHVVDAVVAGQGDGPLMPQPLALGLVLGGGNAAAVDWVGAQLLGYDPARISITREAFEKFRWPLVSFTHKEVMLSGDLGAGVADQVLELRKKSISVVHPAGWRDAAASEASRKVDPENASRAPISVAG